MLLKLSDKVLLNFFILPIFSAGLAAGIRSHIGDDDWSAAAAPRTLGEKVEVVQTVRFDVV